MQWALPPKNFHFLSRTQESVDSPITDHGKARKASRFLKADAVPSVFLFFFFFFRPELEVSLRRSPMEWAWTTKQRKARPWEKACSWLPLAKWWNHSLSKAGGTREFAAQAKWSSWRIRRSSGQHAMLANTQCAFKQDCRKSKAILVGLRSCRWEVWGITSWRGREKKKEWRKK